MRPTRPSVERIAALAVIIAAHLLLLELVSRNGKRHLRSSEPDTKRGELFFIAGLPVNDAPAPQARAIIGNATRAQRPAAPDRNNAITPGESAEVKPVPREKSSSIDWYGQARQVGRADLEKSLETAPRAFGQQPQSPYRQRKLQKPHFEWTPEEKKAGFAGPLPFVRLGKRCVIVPPFFGCTFGKLPKSKGATLEEIRDPDRPRSSVPDLSE